MSTLSGGIHGTIITRPTRFRPRAISEKFSDHEADRFAKCMIQCRTTTSSESRSVLSIANEGREGSSDTRSRLPVRSDASPTESLIIGHGERLDEGFSHPVRAPTWRDLAAGLIVTRASSSRARAFAASAARRRLIVCAGIRDAAPLSMSLGLLIVSTYVVT